MKTINELLQHSEEMVRELGQKAVQYKNQLERHELSPEEYGQLREQLLDLERLAKAAIRETNMQEVRVAVQFLLTYLPAVI